LQFELAMAIASEFFENEFGNEKSPSEKIRWALNGLKAINA
jgi:hypothetical protein